MSRRKCAATTGAPAFTGRVRSTTEGMVLVSRMSVMVFLRPHPEEPEQSEGVSKDGAASCFETRCFTALLSMRPIKAAS